MFGKILCSNSNRKYIFNEGKFYVQPTKNNFKIENGILVSGNSLLIPYTNEKEIVHFDLIPTGAYGDCGISCLREVSHNDYMGKDGLNIRHMYLTSPFSVALESNKVISVNLESYNLKIKSIWTEKNRGGVLKLSLKKLLRLFSKRKELA